MTTQLRCQICGSYLPTIPFYFLKRKQGILRIFICPNCGHRVTHFTRKEVEDDNTDNR